MWVVNNATTSSQMLHFELGMLKFKIHKDLPNATLKQQFVSHIKIICEQCSIGSKI